MEWISALLSIVVINLVLSGDNAVVIGMAAHQVPVGQRRLAIVAGGGGAIVLRVLLTASAALLLTLQGLMAVGGVVLLWIAFNLLKSDEEAATGVQPPSNLRGAVTTILVADLIMSLDNVLGVAAAAHGSMLLLLFGLTLSMIIVMLGGSIVAGLISRLWWLAYVGAAVIAWTGVDMFLNDAIVAEYLPFLRLPWQWPLELAVTLVVLAAAHTVHRRLPARRTHPFTEVMR
jgi:YjbE family integral membrane protein